MNLPKEIFTDRLTLQSLKVEHASQINEAITESFEELSQWLDWCDTIPTIAQTTQFCRDSITLIKNNLQAAYSIFSKEDLYIGNISLIKNNDSIEVGYWLRSSQTGKGYMFEAISKILTLKNSQLKKYRIFLTTDNLNTKSWQLAEKLGFKLQKIIKNDCFGRNKAIRDTRLYIYS